MFFIATIMVFQFTLVANAEAFSNETIYENSPIKTSGITMSASEFSDEFTGEVASRKQYSLAKTKTMNESEITISNVAIKGNDISLMYPSLLIRIMLIYL